MAITPLPTNFKDDIIDTSVNEHLRYKLTQVTGETDTYTFEDKTTYIQVGSVFGADEANATNQAVNDCIEVAETTENNLSDILDGTTAIAKSNIAEIAETSTKLTTAREINGVPFDGTSDITITDDTKVSVDEDFVLINQEQLTFVNNVCVIEDERITESSLADVYFNSATSAIATNADISVDTNNGNVTLTAQNTPSGNITASIIVRVVE